MPPSFYQMAKTRDQVEHLQQAAINKQGTKIREVIHKGFYKYKPEDFKMPVSKPEQRRITKLQERATRKGDFNNEMDQIVI